MYRKINRNGSGEIGPDEMRIAVKRYLPGTTEAEFTMLWTVMDANANGVVDMAEFVSFVEEMKDTASDDTARASSASSSISAYAKDLRANQNAHQNANSARNDLHTETRDDRRIDFRGDSSADRHSSVGDGGRQRLTDRHGRGGGGGGGGNDYDDSPTGQAQLLLGGNSVTGGSSVNGGRSEAGSEAASISSTAMVRVGSESGGRLNRQQMQQRAQMMQAGGSMAAKKGSRPEKPSTMMVRARMQSKSADDRFKDFQQTEKKLGESPSRSMSFRGVEELALVMKVNTLFYVIYNNG